MNENKETNVSKQQVENEAIADVETKKVVESKNELKTKSKDLVKYEDNSNISKLDLFDSVQLASAEAFLSKVMKSKKGGIESVADGLAVLMRANDLSLPFSTCIEHIHVINGKTGIDIHIIKALLSRAGCTWKITKDYQPLYEYTDGINVYNDGALPDYVERCISQLDAEAKAKANDSVDTYYVYPVKWYKDVKGNVYKDYQLTTAKFGVAINRLQIDEITKAGKTAIFRVPNVPIDYITEYEITRNLKGKDITAKGRFSYNEAAAAELLTKDTYVKYARVLISHRAFTYAAREIASDIMFGVMETTELKIVSGKPLNANDLNSDEDTEYVVID